ncbi:cytoplasmic protein [Chelativorans sp. Marseille-P2723]|uniref:cytoplasmic protein n=1 Tax=Chelativorans sp. Marseille-P2723 TaxID=2709133 RepID=UPI00156E8D37|nr:cytoplasmic protein [Chelativorans sp. Marseille-P2723]
MPIPFPVFFPAVAAMLMMLGSAMLSKAHALSDTLPEYVPPEEVYEGVERAPLPNATIASPQGGEAQGDAMRHDPDQGTPEILYDVGALPEPVKRMRQLIIEAARSGDLERLRPLIGSGLSATQLALGALEGDPIDFLREVSGDEDGQEILAILLEIMEAGFVRLNPGTEEELYVWPYFFAIPLEDLTPEQRVELFTIVTAGDYEEMKNFGAYIFFRSGITPDGRWVYFVAGD